MSEKGRLVYTIAEFTEEVIRQLKGVIGERGRVEFEIRAYNPASIFNSDDERSKKGLCVVLDNYGYVDCSILKYTAEWYGDSIYW